VNAPLHPDQILSEEEKVKELKQRITSLASLFKFSESEINSLLSDRFMEEFLHQAVVFLPEAKPFLDEVQDFLRKENTQDFFHQVDTADERSVRFIAKFYYAFLAGFPILLKKGNGE